MHRVLAFCALPYAEAVTAATLATPRTSPPMAGWPWAGMGVQNRVLYFRLHGYQDNPMWDGETLSGRRVPALAPEDVRGQDLRGCLVVAEVCFGATGGEGEMRRAFLDAGATAFIGSSAEVYGREGWRLGEAGRLGSLLLWALRIGQRPERALWIAKAFYARLASRKPMSRVDALTLRSFRVYRA